MPQCGGECEKTYSTGSGYITKGAHAFKTQNGSFIVHAYIICTHDISRHAPRPRQVLHLCTFECTGNVQCVGGVLGQGGEYIQERSGGGVRFTSPSRPICNHSHMWIRQHSLLLPPLMYPQTHNKLLRPRVPVHRTCLQRTAHWHRYLLHRH